MLILLSAPAGVAASQTLLLAVNLWLAARTVEISGRLGRPWPPLPETLALPRIVAPIFVLAAGLCLTAAPLGAVAGVVAAAAGFGLALQGLRRAARPHPRLAVPRRHGSPASMPPRSCSSRWSVVVMALFGLIESAFSLRARKARAIPLKSDEIQRSSNMEVILLERVAKLGQMGEVVRVRDGYARNFLLPRGKALRATEANKKHFDGQRAQLEARNLERKGEAQAVAEKLNGQVFVILRQAGESGQLYGSVATRDIAEAATAGGFTRRAPPDRAAYADQDARPAQDPGPSASGSGRRDHGQRRPLRRGGRASGQGRIGCRARRDLDGRSRPRSRRGAGRGRRRARCD